MKLIEQLKVLDPKEFVIIRINDNSEIFRGRIKDIPSDFLMQISGFEVYLLDSRREKVLFGLFDDRVTYIIHTLKKWSIWTTFFIFL